MSTQRVTWLHISDAHFGEPDMVGESQSVIAMLLQDLERLRDERGLSPDLSRKRATHCGTARCGEGNETPIRAFVKAGVLVREAEAMYQFSDTRLKVYARLREPLTDTARRRLSHHDSEPA